MLSNKANHALKHIASHKSTPHAQLHRLRHRIQAISSYQNRIKRQAPCLDFEIPQGILVGLSGSAKTEWMAHFLAQHPSLKAAWIEDKMTVYPCALAQHQVALSRILFAEVGKQMIWTAQQMLKSNLFQFVITTGLTTHDRALKRLQMMTEKAQATMFLLNDQPYPCWPVALKLHVERSNTDGPLSVEVLKRRV